MERIIEILKGVRDDVDFEKEEMLVDNNIIDSFDIVAIVGELSEEFDITFTAEDIEPENFNSVAAIKKLVDRLVDEI